MFNSHRLLTIYLLWAMLLLSSALTSAQTLCQEFGGLTINQTLGSNAGVPNTSGLGTGISNQNIEIDGVFTITENFGFTNCNIRFTTGSGIVIAQGQAPFAKRVLQLNNSRLFCCSDLWAGIDMQMNTKIETSNNTRIEDAFVAIQAHRCVDLSISSTIFNRNWIGIRVRNYSDCGPVFLKLQSTRFTCDANLNTNTNGTLSFAGIVTRNVPIIATASVGAVNVRMDNMRFGILDESVGGYVLPITIRAFRFSNCREDGIQVIRGDLRLTQCNFIDCQQHGIDANTIFRLDVTGGGVQFTNALPIPPLFITDRIGIFVQNFSASARMTVAGASFVSNNDNPFNKQFGIWLDGANVGADARVDVHGSSFDFTGHEFRAFVINGFFPLNSRVNIYSNSFLLEALGASGTSDGIVVTNGEKNNIHIFNNNPFDGKDGGGRADTGIELNGSDGVNNEVKYNTFPFIPILFSPFQNENAAFAITATNFQNTEYCGNQTGACAVHFDMFGTNNETHIHENTMRGGSATFRLNGFIGSQGISTVFPEEHHVASGNIWLRSHPNLVALNWALCNGTSCNLSPIVVHTVPTPVDFNIPSFHPNSNISPAAGWFLQDLLSAPSECLLDQFQNPNDDELKRRIASFTLTGATIAQQWDMQRNLYKTLARYPELYSKYSGYSSFTSILTNQSAGRMVDVRNMINKGIEADGALVHQVGLLQANADALIEKIEVLDQLINFGTEEEQKSASERKIEYQKQLSTIYDQTGIAQDNYRNSCVPLFTAALQFNMETNVSQIHEQNEKSVNEIWLRTRLYQNDLMTAGQLSTIRQIAAQCPEIGGMAVYRARGMLTVAEQAELNDYALGCIAEDRSFVAPRTLPTNEMTIAPNPANDQITVTNPTEKDAKVRLFSVSGSLVLEVDCYGESTSISLVSLKPGFYFCEMTDSTGAVTTTKLVVER